MNNGIVFSIVINDGEIMETHYLYRQLSHSIKTLRIVNKNIPVKVYFYSKNGLPNNHTKYFPDDNIEFIAFDNIISDNWYPTFLDGGFAKVIEHRWINAFRGLENFNFDNILYMDTDTQFLKDPELLFNLYGNTEFIWTREDTCEDLMKALKIFPGMNDGITVISKNILKHKDNCLISIRNYINYTLAKYRKILTKEQHKQLNWVIIQYAAFDYFYTRNLHKYVDLKHIVLHVENQTNEAIAHHYFTGNSNIFLPKQL